MWNELSAQNVNCIWRSFICRVWLEGCFKNRNRKLDLPKHNSSSCYQNRNIFFDIPVPVNTEPEFQIIVPA